MYNPLFALSSLLPHLISYYLSNASFPNSAHLSQQSQHFQPTYSYHTKMATPLTTILLLQSPPSPAPIPIKSNCELLMPLLLLPLPVAPTQNHPFSNPSTSSNQPSSTPNLQHTPLVNPLSTLSTAKQHFPMSIAFHPRHSTTLPRAIPVPNSSRHPASQSLSTTPSVDLPAVQALASPPTSNNLASSEALQ